MKAVTYGDPFATNSPDMSSQISQAHQEKIYAMVMRAKAAGAELLTGGRMAKTTSGYFFEPTVLTRCRQDMEIMQDEVFGPVMPIMEFRNYEEVIPLANDCQYGLTSSIFTQSRI